MFVRMNTVTGVKDIDAGVTLVREKVLPEVQGQKGFRGLTVSGNKSTGDFGILGLWDTLEDLKASESVVAKLRDEIVSTIGGDISVAVLEQVVAEVAQPRDMTGCSLRLVRIKMDPAKVDEQVGFFKADVVPALKAQPGFVAIRNMIDRSTGEGAVGSVWADEKSMQAAEAGAEERRQQAATRGVTISEPSFRTILFAHLV
jgi:heme-degrading monooxygenase HmoA